MGISIFIYHIMNGSLDATQFSMPFFAGVHDKPITTHRMT